MEISKVRTEILTTLEEQPTRPWMPQAAEHCLWVRFREIKSKRLERTNDARFVAARKWRHAAAWRRSVFALAAAFPAFRVRWLRPSPFACDAAANIGASRFHSSWQWRRRTSPQPSDEHARSLINRDVKARWTIRTPSRVTSFHLVPAPLLFLLHSRPFILSTKDGIQSEIQRKKKHFSFYVWREIWGWPHLNDDFFFFKCKDAGSSIEGRRHVGQNEADLTWHP